MLVFEAFWSSGPYLPTWSIMLVLLLYVRSKPVIPYINPSKPSVKKYIHDLVMFFQRSNSYRKIMIRFTHKEVDLYGYCSFRFTRFKDNCQSVRCKKLCFGLMASLFKCGYHLRRRQSIVHIMKEFWQWIWHKDRLICTSGR